MDEILDRIVPSMRELDKFMKIYSNIAHKISYDLNQIEKETIEEDLDIYAEIRKGKTNSYGYAKILETALNKAGIQAKTIIGTIEKKSHAYNQVKILDKWYNTDLTLDREQIVEGSLPINMLKSDYEFIKYNTKSKEKEICPLSISIEIIEKYRKVLKFESDDIIEIVENVENASNKQTIIAINEDSNEVVLVNSNKLLGFTVTNSEIDILVEKKADSIFLPDKKVVENTLPQIYQKENKIVTFINKIMNIFKKDKIQKINE